MDKQQLTERKVWVTNSREKPQLRETRLIVDHYRSKMDLQVS